MKTSSFIVVSAGYWGKGRTLSNAARECRKAGSPSTAPVVVRLFSDTTEEEHAAITVNGFGQIEYPPRLECIRIVSPADGHKVKLSAIIGYATP